MSADLEEAKATEVKEDAEEDLEKDFQDLRDIITEEGGHTDVEEDDDDETCGFCRFMKAGGCKPEFTAWSACVDANRGEGHNFTEECRDATLALQGCMEAHRDYYKDFMLEPDFDGGTKADEPGADEAAAPGEPPEAQEGAQEEPVAAESASESASEAAEVGYAPKVKLIGNLEEEELPPPETVLSGLDGEFKAGDHSSRHEKPEQAAAEPEPASQEGEAEGGEEGGNGKQQEEPEQEEEQEEEEEKPVIQVRTAAYDARFPSTNQARHCYTRYNEYYRCTAEKGDDAPECSVFQRAYRSICPSEWLERWNEQREEGTWPGRY